MEEDLLDLFNYQNEESDLGDVIYDNPEEEGNKPTVQLESDSGESSVKKTISIETKGKRKRKKSVKEKNIKSKKNSNDKKGKKTTVNEKNEEKQKKIKKNKIKKSKFFSYHFRKKSRFKSKAKLKSDNDSGGSTKLSNDDLYYGSPGHKKGYYNDNINDVFIATEEDSTDFCNFDGLSQISFNCGFSS